VESDLHSRTRLSRFILSDELANTIFILLHGFYLDDRRNKLTRNDSSLVCNYTAPHRRQRGLLQYLPDSTTTPGSLGVMCRPQHLRLLRIILPPPPARPPARRFRYHFSVAKEIQFPVFTRCVTACQYHCLRLETGVRGDVIA
jgi:hypothetical protein